MPKTKIDLDEIKKRTQERFTSVGLRFSKEADALIRSLIKNPEKEFGIFVKNYFIIRCVSAAEFSFKNLLREAIDRYGFSPKGLLNNDEISINVLELEHLKNQNELTTGRIISSQFNFQNLDLINEKFTKLLGGKDFFNNVKQEASKYLEQDSPIFNFKNIYELFELRHHLVHELGNAEQIDFTKLTYWLTSINIFQIVSYSLVGIEYCEKIKNESDDVEELKEYFESLPKTVVKACQDTVSLYKI